MTGQLPAGWPGYLFGAATILLAFLVNWRKGKVDESAVILGKWKDLVDAHEAQIKRLNEDFDSHRAQATSEIADLRQRLQSAELRITEMEAQAREKDKYIVGLEAQIRQNSQSTAHLLGRPEALATSKTRKDKS